MKGKIVVLIVLASALLSVSVLSAFASIKVQNQDDLVSYVESNWGSKHNVSSPPIILENGTVITDEYRFVPADTEEAEILRKHGSNLYEVYYTANATYITTISGSFKDQTTPKVLNGISIASAIFGVVCLATVGIKKKKGCW